MTSTTAITRTAMTSIALAMLMLSAACGGDDAATSGGRATAPDDVADTADETPPGSTDDGGTTTTPASPGGSLDACETLSEAELEAALEVALEPGRSVGSLPDGHICFYQFADSLSGGNVSITLVRGVTAQTYFDGWFEPGDPTEPADVGDQATVLVDDLQSNIIVLSGDALVAIDVVHAIPTALDGSGEPLIELGRRAVDRLST